MKLARNVNFSTLQINLEDENKLESLVREKIRCNFGFRTKDHRKWFVTCEHLKSFLDFHRSQIVTLKRTKIDSSIATYFNLFP